MSQRPDATKWLWCVLAMLAGPACKPTGSVNVRSPPKNPTTIEAQAKFFQDFFSVQLSPYNIEFGHVCEDPNTWEQRYEKKDFKNHRDMGKVRWGDKQGGYGEHYWDLNHAGHGNDHSSDEYDGHSDDDGSYNHDLDHAHDDHGSHDDTHDAYDEPSEQSPSYGVEEYDVEKAAKYDDENGRSKRTPPRVKSERKLVVQEEMYEEPQKIKPQKFSRKIKERLQTAPTQQVEKITDEKPDSAPQLLKRKRQQRRPQHVPDNVNIKEEANSEVNAGVSEQREENHPKEKNIRQEQQPQYYTERQPEKQFVPYEHGAGVRQHHKSELSAAASVPRLFLEPTTGHVVDRATGQAYVLQPIAVNNYN